MAWLESDFKMELKNTLKYHLGSKGPEKYHMVRKIRDRSTYVTSALAGRGYPSSHVALRVGVSRSSVRSHLDMCADVHAAAEPRAKRAGTHYPNIRGVTKI